jgi:hypothetical protein
LFAKKLPVLREMVRPIYARIGVSTGTTSTLRN